MEPLAVHHIGVAVPSIDEAMHFYGEKLGLRVADTLELPDRQLKVTFVQASNILIELLEPMDPDTPVARFLERRGPGLHHLCFGTTDIQEHLRDLKDKGVELIDEAPRAGAHGEVAFLQPTAALGVLVELLQPTADSARTDTPEAPRDTTEPPRDTTEPPRDTAEPPPGAAQPPPGAAQPPPGAAQPPPGTAEPPPGTAEPPVDPPVAAAES